MAMRYWLILVAIGAAFGVSFAFNHVLLAHYGPLTVSALRVGIGAAGCWTWVLATGRSAALPPITVAGIALFGVFQFAAPFAVLPLAQQHITSATAGIANAMTPAAVVMISHLWPGGERATLGRLAGVAFGIAGIAILATRGGAETHSDPRFVLLALGAPACYAIALNLVRRFRGLDPVVLTAWALTGGGLAIAPLALAADGLPAAPGASTLAALLAVGIGLTSVAFIAMYAILPRVGATNLSLVTFVAPISATCVGALAFGEVIGGGHLIGMGLILAGLVTIDGRLPRHLARRAAGLSEPGSAA
ncbi:DMT family transporter [Amaricoccus solimangrovi]|uniref:DMT family transporter n=1 Tax=Amaricoccus solimangrovi TaxID=2589815 RepID=A0A501X0V1_9RHOB|nr:DMT family transporter [Amaricoccus solimangrovi]TPE52676.1 DMT family transporter [Amaricoccus solimangrovi]